MLGCVLDSDEPSLFISSLLFLPSACRLISAFSSSVRETTNPLLPVFGTHSPQYLLQESFPGGMAAACLRLPRPDPRIRQSCNLSSPFVYVIMCGLFYIQNCLVLGTNVLRLIFYFAGDSEVRG